MIWGALLLLLVSAALIMLWITRSILLWNEREDRKHSFALPPGGSERDWCGWIVRRCEPFVGASVEVALPDGSRVDLLTRELAAEVDFARKWKEGVGQAAWYGHASGRTGALVLIVGDRDAARARRAEGACRRAGLRLYLVSERSGQIRRMA